MANKDRGKWLKLFNDKFGYKPHSELRKRKEYIRKVSLHDALEIASESGSTFIIQVTFPFSARFPLNKQRFNAVAVFPQSVNYNKETLFELKEPILYKNKFYSIDKFISTCPYSPENDGGIFCRYEFSLPYFMLGPTEINSFRKLYLTPIKKKIVETNIYPDLTGKIKKPDSIAREFKKVLINKYLTLKKRKRVPIKTLQKELDFERNRRFPEDSEKAEKYMWSDQTIRRLIQPYIKK